MLVSAVKYLLRQLALMGNNVLQVLSSRHLQEYVMLTLQLAALLRRHVRDSGRAVLWLLSRPGASASKPATSLPHAQPANQVSHFSIPKTNFVRLTITRLSCASSSQNGLGRLLG